MRHHLSQLLGTYIVTVAASAPSNPRHGDLGFDFPDATSPERFTIRVEPKLVDFAKERARTYRAPQSLSSQWEPEGAPADLISELAGYWADEYDWASTEDQINELEHYATTVSGNRNYEADIPLHFIHHRSDNDAAVPLLLLHGWSSTHLEWKKVIEPLIDAFHIVAPDLPGHGFGPAPAEPGLGPREMGIAFDSMMKQLGYETYGIVTTDLGMQVGTWMVHDVGQSIIGHFTDFLLLLPTTEDLERMANNQTTQEENEYIAGANEFTDNHFAYSTVQAQKPLALAWSMTDSPVGFASWLWDLKYLSSDGYPYTPEEVITESFVLWIQGPYGGMRSYLEFFKPENMVAPKTDIPTGVTQWGSINGPFPKLARFPLAPRSWVDRVASVVFFKRYEFGGHFPALHETELYAKDVREFFSSLV